MGEKHSLPLLSPGAQKETMTAPFSEVGASTYADTQEGTYGQRVFWSKKHVGMTPAPQISPLHHGMALNLKVFAAR